MKKSVFRYGVAALALLLLFLPTLSCSRQEETGQRQTKLTPEQKRQQEELRKGVEESKKVPAARVNGVDIPMFELVRMMNILAPQHIKAGRPKDPAVDEAIRKEALDRLIFEELAFQEANRLHIAVKPDAVDDVIKKLKQQLGSAEAFDNYLKETALTEKELSRRIERRHKIELVTAQEVYDKIVIDERRLRKEYDRNKNKYVLPERFLAEDIFLKGAADDTAAATKGAAVLALLKKHNNDFTRLREDTSIAVSIGRIVPERHPAVYQHIKGMQVGEVSGPIKDADGYHIIKLVSKEPARQLDFDESRDMVKRQLKAVIGAERLKAWDRELRNRAKIEIAAAEVRGSGPAGGSKGK